MGYKMSFFVIPRSSNIWKKMDWAQEKLIDKAHLFDVINMQYSYDQPRNKDYEFHHL